jgi:hypothetical protein
MVFILGGESCSVPAQDRLNTWTLGGIAIDQVSTYVPGVVYQEDGSWQAHAQGAPKMQAAYGLEATAVMQQSADKVRLLMVQTFIYSAVMYGAEVWTHDEGGQRQDVSGRKKAAAF